MKLAIPESPPIWGIGCCCCCAWLFIICAKSPGVGWEFPMMCAVAGALSMTRGAIAVLELGASMVCREPFISARIFWTKSPSPIAGVESSSEISVLIDAVLLKNGVKKVVAEETLPAPPEFKYVVQMTR